MSGGPKAHRAHPLHPQPAGNALLTHSVPNPPFIPGPGRASGKKPPEHPRPPNPYIGVTAGTSPTRSSASEAAPPVTCRALVLAARLAAAALQLDHAGAYSRDHTPTAVLWDQASCPLLCFAFVAAAVGAVGEAGTWDRWDALEEASRCSEPVLLWCARGGALWG